MLLSSLRMRQLDSYLKLVLYLCKKLSLLNVLQIVILIKSINDYML